MAILDRFIKYLAYKRGMKVIIVLTPFPQTIIILQQVFRYKLVVRGLVILFLLEQLLQAQMAQVLKWFKLIQAVLTMFN